MSLGKTIARESLDHGKDVRRQSLLDPPLAASRDKPVLVLDHLLGQLLAHCFAQTISLSHGKTGEEIGDPDDLFLIECYPVGLSQNRLDVRMNVLYWRTSVFSRDVVGRHRHRS